MYGLGFWSLEGPLLPHFGRPLRPPPRRPLLLPLGGPPPPPGNLLPPPSKGSPTLLLLGATRPLVASPPTFPIGDGMPLYSWYDFLVGMIFDNLGL